jgi:thermostable 8-oxoguanine DNA glycosylase
MLASVPSSCCPWEEHPCQETVSGSVLPTLGVPSDWDKAVAAVNYLDCTGELWVGNRESIEKQLRAFGYRRPAKGAGFIWDNRQSLYHSGLIVPLVRVLETLCNQDPVLGRNILAGQNKDTQIQVAGINIGKLNFYVPGVRMKWASHFLSELGFSHNQLAILDSHVLELLVCFGLLTSVPKPLTPRAYLDIEKKMKGWARSNLGSIPLDHLNWVLWKMVST